MGALELLVRSPSALSAACAVFRRRARPFAPADLRALREVRLDPAYVEAVIPFYASSVLGERAAAAYAARAALDAPEPLRAGFAVQAADEERHAALDEVMLARFGVEPARARSITPGVAREMEESLAEHDQLKRMFLTNFIAETALAGATFPFVISLAAANGDGPSVRLNEARLADERRHVAFAARAFEILVAQDARNRAVLQAWQDEHFAQTRNAFVEEVVPALERAPHRPPGDWLGGVLAAYRRRAARLGLRAP